MFHNKIIQLILFNHKPNDDNALIVDKPKHTKEMNDYMLAEVDKVKIRFNIEIWKNMMYLFNGFMLCHIETQM